MAEFDDRLDSLLSNPEAMNQIMEMAQSLMGGGQEAGNGSTASAPGGGGSPLTGQSASPGNSSAGAWGSVSAAPPGQDGGNPGGVPGGRESPPRNAPGDPRGTAPFGNAPAGGSPMPDPGFLSGLGAIDPKTIAALVPVLRELGGTQDSNARRLLMALRPYLKPERQDKVERALQLARLFRVGKRFLLKGEDHV